MGDNAGFEKLSTLEARLATALDRIATGLAAVQQAAPAEDPGVTSGAFEDALIRAETAEAQLVQRDGVIAGLRADVAAAQAAARVAEDAAARAAEHTESGGSDLAARIDDLEARLVRARAERAEAIAERDAARDIAEEMEAAGGSTPDDRAMALRAEVQELRAVNDRLTRQIGQLRGERATDPAVLNKALVVELDALKAARASEAAELDRILADLDLAHAGADAERGEHA